MQQTVHHRGQPSVLLILVQPEDQMGGTGDHKIGQEHACAVGGCGEGSSEHQDSQEGQEDLSPEEEGDGCGHGKVLARSGQGVVR